MSLPVCRRSRRHVTLVAISTLAMACAPGMMGAPNPAIRAPQAYVSPDMDFTKIGTIGVFPLFPASSLSSPYGSVTDDTFGESMVSALSSEVQTRQGQWRMVDYKEMLTLINKANLGTGYKNLQADMNTSYGGLQGSLVLSPATRKFMADIQKAAGVDAFLIGSYTLTREPRVMGSVVTMTRVVDVAEVRLVLFAAKANQAWWTASVGRFGAREGIVREIAQSLATNLGKGTLRQM